MVTIFQIKMSLRPSRMECMTLQTIKAGSMLASVQTLLILADAGGSNGYRSRLWKKEVQKFSNKENLEITVCHFPPGTSKWNKIEHRLFSQITLNWRGKPLTSYEVVVNLIAATNNSKGLRVKYMLDTNKYPIGTKIEKKQVEELDIIHDEFHGEWNYTFKPKNMVN